MPLGPTVPPSSPSLFTSPPALSECLRAPSGTASRCPPVESTEALGEEPAGPDTEWGPTQRSLMQCGRCLSAPLSRLYALHIVTESTARPAFAQETEAARL